MFISTALLLLVIAVSLDSFTVGMTYGMKRVKISFLAITIIMLCSAFVVMTSMSIGHILSLFISEKVTNMFGGFIFILIGIIVLLSLLRTTYSQKEDSIKDDTELDDLKTVLKSPHKADLDDSGTISIWEATLLGIALALDAFGAGIGAALLGFSTVITTGLIAVMSGFFLFTGCLLGFQLLRFKLFQKLTYTSPFILILLGLYNLF